jgi:hypothetical protein
MLVIQRSGFNNDIIGLVFGLRRKGCPTITAKLAPCLETSVAVGKV